jgi:hypothetical protein
MGEAASYQARGVANSSIRLRVVEYEFPLKIRKAEKHSSLQIHQLMPNMNGCE